MKKNFKSSFQAKMSSLVVTDEAELNIFERLGRTLSFYSAVIPVLASYLVLEQTLKINPVSQAEEKEQYNQLHDWGSDVLLEKMNELKGYYVKTGQIISTRVDIFPEQYTSKFAGK
jgi:aarF domain-containing kinase